MSNENTGNINSEVSSQLTSLLGGQSSLSSLVSGLASAAKLNESKVDKVHDKAYNQDGAEALSNQDLGAAAGKQAFEQLFNGSNSELASSVTNMFSTAATSKDTNDRSISDILSSFSSQGSQGSGSQKGTFEKIVDLIAKEVLSKGNASNQGDVAAAATQTFTQLMIKKKIYEYMGMQAPADKPADHLTNFLGTLGGGNNNSSGNGGSNGVSNLLGSLGGSGSAGGLGALASQFLGGHGQQQQQNQQNQQQGQQNQQQGQQHSGADLLSLAGSMLSQGQQGQQQQQSQQQQSGGADYSQLIGMAGSMLSSMNKK